MKPATIATLLMMNGYSLFSQEPIPREMIEKAAENFEIPADNSVLQDELTEKTLHPVNLNNTTMKEVESIPYLTPDQSFNLQDYLLKYGEILSIYELQAIPGFDSLIIRKIEPFILIKPKSPFPGLTPGNLLRYGKQSLIIRFSQAFPKPAGYLAGDSERIARPGYYYPGSPGKYYFRYSYNYYDKIKIGIGGEKDPGEEFFSGAQKSGMDHYAGFISFHNTGILENLVIGNFRAGFGQGLTFGSGLSVSAAPGFNMDPTPAGGIRPSMGMNELNYLRGLALTLQFKKIVISPFVSWHSRDAAIPGESENAELSFSSFSGSGYHRTNLELAKHNTVKELIAGGHVQITFTPNQQFGFRIGLTGAYIQYSMKMAGGKELYERFSFSGDKNIVSGVDCQIRYRKIQLFGEVSRSLNGGIGWIGGLTTSPDPRINALLLFRNYTKAYQNPYAGAFGQFSSNANESGVFTSVTSAIGSKMNMTVFLDLYGTHWPGYRTVLPFRGQEFGISLNFIPVRQVILNFRYLQKNSETNTSAETGQVVHKLTGVTAQGYRIGMDWLLRDGISLTSRVDVKSGKNAESKIRPGFCITEDLSISLQNWLQSISFRISMFNIPSYETRIYIYEPEVLFGYSVPAYQGNGLRTLLVLKFRCTKFLTFWVRGAITRYSDRTSVGTGLDATAGNYRGEFTGQVMIRF